ncbi:uncharacterized protein LOC131431964 [Malaya genurostris]|uniref:uncharacterized protein LOC131431964 n=1 Tax=Malaya genurostris TaxID=325434 RepID=UPI0026F386A4|nr:uncharacterized protein LOC131431964 [Malaya genurostris]
MRGLPEGHICNLPHDSGTNLVSIGPETSVWTRICRRVRKCMLLSPEHPDTSAYFKSFAQIANENKRLVEDFPVYIIHPLSVFRKYWDIVMFITLTIHMLTLSFVVSYLIYIDVADFPWIIRFDMVLSAILTAEVLMKFITGYVVAETKEVVLEPGKIVWNYLRYFRVVYDMLGAFPFILFLYKLDESYYNKEPLFYLILILFLYVVHLFRFIDINRYFEVLPKFFNASENKVMIMKLIIATIYVLHWTSCISDIFPLVAMNSPIRDRPSKETILMNSFLTDLNRAYYRHMDLPGFLQLKRNLALKNPFPRTFQELVSAPDQAFVVRKINDAVQNETLLRLYIRSIMDSIHVALQSVHVETNGPTVTYDLLTSYLVFAGWIWLTYVTLTLIRVIISYDLSETKYDEIVNELNAFAHNKRLNAESKDKMLRHFANRYRMKYFNEEEIQNTISNNLRRSIRMETCQHLVKNVELFRNLPHALIEDIVDRLTMEVFLENDVIIQAGTFGDAMYFIASGTAAVYSVAGRELGHLVDGAHFGEISLLKRDQKRTANVVALEACEVYKLSYADFQLLIEPHSNLLGQMQKLADERLAKIQQARDKVSEEDVYENFLQ